MPSGLPDEQIALTIVHRIFVTNNPDDFLEAAAVEEFSIIDTRHAIKDAKLLAQQISRAFIDYELKAKQPFLLTLNQDKDPVLRLID